MTDDPFDDPRLTAMGLLAETFHGVAAKVGAVMSANGITGSDFDILIRLARSPGGQLRMTDLAAQAGFSTSGVTRIVDRLEGRGLVCRQACPTDRRSLITAITDDGKAKLAGFVPELADTIERWFTGALEPARLADLLDGLRAVRDHVNPDATAGANQVGS